MDARSTGPLTGLRVLDLGTVYAAPITAMLLGDWGADVIKVEHPRGDPARTHGLTKDGHGLWWKVIARNKRTITLNFSKPEGQDILRRLVAQADVVIENFRPGRAGEVGPRSRASCCEINPALVVLRVTGFGQTGPYAKRRAFGTLAEAMSGLAHQTGQEDGPPTLPPFGLADGVAGLTGAYAVMLALYHRDASAAAGAGHRPVAAGTAGRHPRARGQRVRPARAHLRPARQPVHQQRPPQRLPDERRPLGGDLGQRHLGRRAGDAPGRPAGHRRAALVLPGRRAGRTRRHDRRAGRGMDRRAGLRGGHPPPSRTPVPRSPRSTTSSSSMNDPHVQERGGDHHHRRRGPRPAEDAEPDLPDGRAPPGAIRHGGRRLGQDTDSVLDELLGISGDKLDELRSAGSL